MWSDRETLDDLLGFHVLVESLMTLLTEPRLVPVTIGVDGDWGSGKSSLLKMAEARLTSEERYVTVTFSPWMHEDYDDIKVALVTSVLRSLRDAAPAEAERIDVLLRIVRGLTRVARFGKKWVPMAVTAVAASHGVDPAQASALGALSEGVADEAINAVTDLESAETHEDLDQPMLVAEFREKLASLMKDLKDEIAGVVVLIDDVDRCLPEAVVETFEAIRLFSDIEGTAFVVAAHRSMVEAAIDARYARLNYGEMPQPLGNNYLEKMWHITLRVPPLSPPEVETYLNLLLCELHLGDEPMDRLRTWVRNREPSATLISLNRGTIEAELVDELPDDLVRDLDWVANIAHAAAEGLRGNPRQVKRFVNRLRLYARTLDRMGQPVDHAVLAKLLLLDEIDPNGFATLMRWTIAQSGRPTELEAAEDPERSDDGYDETVSEWIARESVEQWLGLEPPLAGLDLLPYVHIGRESAPAGRVASRLTPALQGHLKRLGSKSQAVRRQAVADVQRLGPTDQELVKAALLDIVPRAPRAYTTESALLLADQDPGDFLPAVVEVLGATDKRKVHPPLPMSVATTLRSHPDAVVPLLEGWTNGTSDDTAKAARVALRRLTDSPRRES